MPFDGLWQVRIDSIESEEQATSHTSPHSTICLSCDGVHKCSSNHVLARMFKHMLVLQAITDYLIKQFPIFCKPGEQQ